jgi:xylulokinase
MLIGIDIGTSGAKAIAIDEDGKVVASATEEYGLDTPRPLWSEQDPERWWQATVVALRRLLLSPGVSADSIDGVGLTGQMHGLVLLDGNGEVLRPAILWNDQRTGSQCEEITRRAGGLETVVGLTGNAVLPGFTAGKLLWVKQNEPDVFERAAHFLLPKDYIRYRLTGAFFTEVSDASGTALFDVKRRRWSEEMAELVGVPHNWFPECAESPVASATISEVASVATGLRAGTLVAGGAGDQAAQAVGSGIVKPGVISVTTGTSGVVFAYQERYEAECEGRVHVFCHAVPGAWHSMGVMLSAGGALRWFRDSLGHSEKAIATITGEDTYEILMREAACAPAGCEGLLFLPYLTGERTPYPDPNARGAFVGLTLRHGKAELARAVLEGVAFGLRDSLELIQRLGVPIHQVRASGGGARSPLWRQIQADVFDAELVLTDITEGAAFGAALLAGVGVGVYPSVEAAASQAVRLTGRTLPQADVAPVYRQLYPVYRSLYGALKPAFDAVRVQPAEKFVN